MKVLTLKQKMFVVEYLIDLNATQAAIRAGYSVKTANRIASENLSKPDIQEAIAREMEERSERLEITQDYVLWILKETIERCMQKIPVMTGKGENCRQATDDEGNHMWKFAPNAVNRAVELLGKHLGMFTGNINHDELKFPTGVNIIVKCDSEKCAKKKKFASRSRKVENEAVHPTP